MEEINRSAAATPAPATARCTTWARCCATARKTQKQRYLPKIATGELRLQSMGVTEPTTGTDTTKIKTIAVRKGDRYVVNGQKVWISRIQHSDLMILLARTTPLAEVKQKSEGMSIFLVDLHEAIGKGLSVQPIRNMVNHETNELFFDNLEIPAENLIGEEGRGFKYILDGLNAERTLIAAECIGDGWWFIDKATPLREGARSCSTARSARTRACSFRSRESYIETEAANLMRFEGLRAVRRAAALRRRGEHGQVPGGQGVAGRRPTPACRPTAASASRRSTTSSASSARRGSTRWRRSRRT